jgi:N-acetylated-alpha-linked acidic dipeptidase
VRRVNDMMMLLERTFIDDQGLPLRPELKHLILAPSALNSYSGSSFPGVYDLMWTYLDAIDRDLDDPEDILEDVKKHISVITFHVNAASKFVQQSFF